VRALFFAPWLLLCAAPAAAQFKSAERSDLGPQLDRPTIQRLKVGVVIKAVGGPCQGLYCTLPVPIDWPEQQVKVVEEDISPTVRLGKNRLLGGTVSQMVVEVPHLASGQVARAVLTYEITRHTLAPPAQTDPYVVPARPGRQLTVYLGPSPLIESKHPKITALAREITAGHEGAWQQVEALYDWVRAHVAYENGPLKGALRALQDKTGDCEELTSLFVALCRAHKVPARCVWVDGHCFPEFYLEDGQGQGHWFPCQAAGERAFGGIPEGRAILQKGDNFKDPDRPRERQRYVSEFLKGSAKSGGQPKVTFIRETVPSPSAGPAGG
jgi:hypothetical protein